MPFPRPSLVLVLVLACACGSSAPGVPAPTEVAPIAEAEEEPPADVLPEAAGAPAPDEPLSIEAPPDVAAPPPDAQVTASGLSSRVLRPGHSPDRPAASDRVTVHYVGWTTDGQRFDSSVERGEPATFPLDALIAGWTEGIQLMVVGERRRFWIPEDLAYQGRPGRPQGMLVFDVELIAIQR